MTTISERITPELAQIYLGTSPGNRRIKSRVVEAYVREILSGNFKETHQGIAFDEDGKLLDGHHRLTAIVKAGQPVRMRVTRGVKRSDVVYVDNGTARTLQDAMHFAGMYTDDPMMTDNRTIGAVRAVLYNSTVHRFQHATYDEILFLMDKMSEQLHVLYKASTKHAPTNVLGAALAAMLNGVSADDIRLFFAVYCSGLPIEDSTKNTTIVYNWKQQQLKDKINRVKKSKYQVYNDAQNVIWHFVKGTKVSRYRPSATQRYPVRDILIRMVQGMDA